MKIVFLIGNGFDLNIGLHTSFNDFLSYYVNKESPTESIKKIKQLLKQSKDDWKDFEMEIGDITKDFSDAEEFSEAFTNISDNLRQYIEGENARVITNEKAKGLLCRDFSLPFDFLTPASKQDFTYFFSNLRQDRWEVNLISFNYTDSIEKILSYKPGMELGKNLFSQSVVLNGIDHIHGRHDGTILLGVNDISQIANESFRTNQDITELLVKPQANHAIESLIDQRCAGVINNANLIVIFGSSIGPTDNYWWDLIKKRLSQKSAKLIIFYYKKNLDISKHQYLLGSYKRKIKHIIEPNGNSDINQFIDVAINEDIFMLKDCCIPL